MARTEAAAASVLTLTDHAAVRQWIGRCLAIAAAAGTLAVVGVCAWEAWRLPSAEDLRANLYSRQDPAARAVWLPLWAIADTLQVAVIVWEDPAFYHHGALNPPAIAHAALANLRSGRYERGGSTLTQQVVKNQFLGREKTLRRKLREMILASRLERVLDKDEILTAYLNIAEWGRGIAGAEAAARHYFGKPAAELDWAQAALLAGMLPNPHQRNPCDAPAEALAAREAVLAKLHAHAHLDDVELRRALDAPLAPCLRVSAAAAGCC